MQTDDPSLFSVLSPRPDEVVVGPLQLVLKFRPGVEVQQARVSGVQGTAEGLCLNAHTRAFLLPTPVQTPVALHLQADAGATRIDTRFSVYCRLPETGLPEQPYEFREARRCGMVLQRQHIYSSGPPNRAPDGQTLAYITNFGNAPYLDVGCGVGAYLAALPGGAATSMGVEINLRYVQEARRQGLNVHIFDGLRLPFRDKSFDTLFAVEVLEHVPRWEALLHEMLRVARRRVLLTTPNIGVLGPMARHGVTPWHILEGTHVNFFTAEAWRHIILNSDNLNGFVQTYGPLRVNDDIFDLHLLVCMDVAVQGQEL